MIRLDIDNLPDGIASRMLAQSGIAAIWKLHVAAAIVYRTGNLPAAASIMDLADAAEREWMMVVNVAANTE
jgi:hypothetical protein